MSSKWGKWSELSLSYFNMNSAVIHVQNVHIKCVHDDICLFYFRSMREYGNLDDVM